MLLERFTARIQQQDEKIACLKDEESMRKDEKKQPKFRGSPLDSKTDRAAKAGGEFITFLGMQSAWLIWNV